MPVVRTYDQYCGLAKALDLVGERWTLLIVRDLALGPQRYSDLLGGLSGIGTSLLARRLRHLEAIGVVRRSTLPPPAASTVYELTDEGSALAEALLPLGLWGAHRLEEEARGTFRADWLLFSVGAMFDAERARGVREVYELHIEGQVVHIRVDDGSVQAFRGPSPLPPDLVAETDAATLLAVATGRTTVEDAVASGATTIEGTDDALRNCIDILTRTVPAHAR